MAEFVQAHFGGGEEIRGPENFIHLGPPSRIIEKIYLDHLLWSKFGLFFKKSVGIWSEFTQKV